MGRGDVGTRRIYLFNYGDIRFIIIFIFWKMKMNAQYIYGIKTGTDVFGVVNVRHIIYNFP